MSECQRTQHGSGADPTGEESKKALAKARKLLPRSKFDEGDEGDAETRKLEHGGESRKDVKLSDDSMLAAGGSSEEEVDVQG